MKPDKLIIQEDETLVRDTKNNAILNRDMTALEKYRAKRQKDYEILKTVNEVKEMKSELSEIKTLLHQLIAEKK